MNLHISHINLFDLFFIGTMFIGLIFALLLCFTMNINQAANRFLALALVVMVLWMVHIANIDIRLQLQFSMALGPLIYLYVLKLTLPEYKFDWKDLLHFIPVLPEQVSVLKPVLPLLTFISLFIYLYCSHRLIKRFYRRLKFIGGDRYRNELQWLHRLLLAFGLLCLLCITYTVAGYFGYHNQLDSQAYCSLYLLLASAMIWIAVRAHLRPAIGVPATPAPILKPILPADLKLKGIWLKNIVKETRYYLDPELSLTLLAEKLGLTTHELSRIINTALKKSFNDFINEYRVAEVKRRMQDPAYDGITLLGIQNSVMKTISRSITLSCWQDVT